METTLYQHCTNVFQRCFDVFQRCFNVTHGRCINVVRCWKSDVGFCFIFKVGSKLFQRWSTMLKQCWSDVEMLAGSAMNSFYDDILFFFQSFPTFRVIWNLETLNSLFNASAPVALSPVMRLHNQSYLLCWSYFQGVWVCYFQ